MTALTARYWMNEGLAAIAAGLSEEEYVSSKHAALQHEAARGYRNAFTARFAKLKTAAALRVLDFAGQTQRRD